MSIATGNHDDEGTIDSCDICFGECEGFCSPFRISSDWTAMLIEYSTEKFEDNLVEVLFLVVTNNGQDAVC